MTSLEKLVKLMTTEQLEEINRLNSQQVQLCGDMIRYWEGEIADRIDEGKSHEMESEYLDQWLEWHHASWIDWMTGVNEYRRRWGLDPVKAWRYKRPFYDEDQDV